MIRPSLSLILALDGKEKSLEDGLTSLLKLSGMSSCEYIVCGGPEAEPSISFVKKWVSQLPSNGAAWVYVYLSENFGNLARARREGLLASKGEYVSLVNPDLHVNENLYARLLETARRTRKPAIASPSDKSEQGIAFDVISGHRDAAAHTMVIPREYFSTTGIAVPEEAAEVNQWLMCSAVLASHPDIEEVEFYHEMMPRYLPLGDKRLSPARARAHHAAVEYLESWMKIIDNVPEPLWRALEIRKMHIKHRALRSLKGQDFKEAAAWWNESLPSALEGSGVGFWWRLALLEARNGRTWLYRLFNALRPLK